jgi:hypothetical protein
MQFWLFAGCSTDRGEGSSSTADDLRAPAQVTAQASVTPGAATANQEVTVHLSVTSTRSVTVDVTLRVLNPDGSVGYTGSWQSQNLVANTALTLDEAILVEPSDPVGSYSVGARVQRTGSTSVFFDKNGLASFSVSAAGGGSSSSGSSSGGDGGTSLGCPTLTSTSGSITDSGGNVWTLVVGSDGSLVVDVNGSPAGYSDNVVELVEVGGVIYQTNSAGGWWSWTNGGWTSASNPTAACTDGGSSSSSSGGSSGSDSGSGSSSGGTGIPTGLRDHFGLGIAMWGDTQASWMQATQAPWDYAYTYIGSSSLGGYATSFMTLADSVNAIPILTSYEMQSNATGLSASVMNPYFTYWVGLLQQIGTFNKPVIVHSEPDMWSGFQTQSDDPNQVSVSVGSSGFAEVSGFADTAAGFAQALVALRDKYAPKALLAIANEGWGVGWGATDGSLPATPAARVAAFYQKLGAKFDLFFFDTMDRNSAYCQYVAYYNGAPPGPAQYCWWGSSPDGTVQNNAFDYFRQYIAAIHSATGLPSMLWQTPVGNTLYDSCDNTPMHYQDNKAQYFLEQANRPNITAYAAAGVIGVLFGSGQPGEENAGDSTGAPYNPAPIDGNTLVSQYGDDEGGFLRVSAAAYYTAGPVPIP